MNVPELEVRVSAPTVCGDLLDTVVEGNDGKRARGFFSLLQSLVSHGHQAVFIFLIFTGVKKNFLYGYCTFKKQLVTFKMPQSRFSAVL